MNSPLQHTEEPSVGAQLKALWLRAAHQGAAQLGRRVFGFYQTRPCRLVQVLFFFPSQQNAAAGVEMKETIVSSVAERYQKQMIHFINVLDINITPFIVEMQRKVLKKSLSLPQLFCPNNNPKPSV